MSTIKVFNSKGADVGEIAVADDILVTDRGEQAVKDTIVAIMNGRRAGTASTLRKGEVAGSNKKPWKQKGTGRARAGLRQSPVWRGGGVAFGPHPRDYSQKVNKKVVQLAFRRALSDRIAEGGVKIVDDLSLPEAKTKLVREMCKGLGVTRACLFVTAATDPVFMTAARNLPRIEVVPAKDVGVYHVVRYPMIVVARPAWETLEAKLKTKSAGRKTKTAEGGTKKKKAEG